ncbi:MAG TPA: efflux RND transporter periplasmic adaptor subunit [Prolixibacteraceae bacterium]|nr:efflux RND transporter periplasmic adaptor subunit [Prolixibacteraceae bacterium]
MNRKKMVNGLLLFAFILFVSCLIWKKKNNRPSVPDFLLGHLFDDVIVVKEKLIGQLVSSSEVEIKSSVSGVIEKLYIQVGDYVREGDPVASIKPTPEPGEMEEARKKLKAAEIMYELEKGNFIRKMGLEAKGGISQAELETAKGNLALQELEWKAAQKQLRLLLEGYIEENQIESNLVSAPASGIVTEVFVKIGQSIIKRNSQTEGSSLAVVSDWNQLLFKGKIRENDIALIRPGKALRYTINAYPNLQCFGEIIRIDPQAVKGEKPVVFPFEASIDFPSDSLEVKTGLTVEAEWIRQKTDTVLCIEEKYIHYSGDSVFVKTIDPKGNQTIKLIQAGITDGEKTEIREGLEKGDRLLPVSW